MTHKEVEVKNAHHILNAFEARTLWLKEKEHHELFYAVLNYLHCSLRFYCKCRKVAKYAPKRTESGRKPKKETTLLFSLNDSLAKRKL